MYYEIREDLCCNTIEYYGVDYTTIVAMEEASELSKELSKMLRDIGDKNHLAEEIADVLITISEVCIMYDIDKSEIDEWIKYKQLRTDSLIKGDA